ncbi:hypothetical protein [Roseomonas indoligenes]|uniref:MalT-like TPR region domain-containing protein n=1 Tax=Roseomonas indoligenes TaxID=2820811 RepID=A0A940MQU6_9PROT|nr:hypothetical protein [Pararoseomonas indoligenes]MBP0491794.1 hypothetical protein [Pararoseomonas indoligenes]
MALNPVERRLLDLRALWEEFTGDPARRLLVWEAPGAAIRLVECFFEAQKHEAEYTTRDLCIVLKAPFEHSIQYSRALKAALAGIYAASEDDLAREGIAADWDFDPDGLPDSAWGFVQALRSFGARYHRHIGHLAAVLMPTEVSDDAAFGGWLRRALASEMPERLRLVVTDPLEQPRLRALAGAGDPRIQFLSPAVDMLALAQETFAQEVTVGPAGVFRNLLMALVALVEKAPAAVVRAKAADAFDFAKRQGWDDQQVAIAVLVAGAQLKEGRFDEAVRTYRVADEAAGRAVQAGHPAGQKLLIQARFGEAGAHLAAGRPAEAARCYDEAAEIALRIPDLLLAVEAMRMGAFCHARQEDAAGALERGRRALDTGARLRPEVRGMTTLPVAASAMLRVLDPSRMAALEAVGAEAAARSDAVLEAAEARATQLERTTGPEVFAAVEKELALRRAADGTEAEARLQALVAGGTEAFRQAFAAGRALLGPAWPLGVEGAAGS